MKKIKIISTVGDLSSWEIKYDERTKFHLTQKEGGYLEPYAYFKTVEDLKKRLLENLDTKVSFSSKKPVVTYYLIKTNYNDYQILTSKRIALLGGKIIKKSTDFQIVKSEYKKRIIKK